MSKILYLAAFLFPVLTFAQQVNLRVPELTIPATVAEWKAQRKTIRETLWSAMGDLPPRPKVPAVQILSREDKGSYVLEKFQFDNEAGAVVPGYFLIPKNGKSKHPAIYYCHWHGGNYDLGKNEIFTTHHTPQIPAEALTRLGYAVIAIDTYCFGERSGKGPGGPEETGSAEELSTSKYELWFGRSLWGMMVRDDLMALEYLFSRPEIDVTNVAATGISMGATRTWWMMALDERIKTGVAVGCLTRYQDLIAEQKLKYHGIYYFMPGVLKYFDSEGIISLIAPRPVLFMTGDEDPGSPVNGILKIEEVLKRIYALHGAEAEFKNIIYPNTAHVYTPVMWENMLQWMQSQLK
ncbi:MAG: dienelactone hydrolase [Cyclobacteriaceae bacterium]|nr:dienelactone hydrolase [Cyclobacteriaceae bacterium]MDH4296548.1 dienelactone hydrolase [Cyclobacteriaceae bacterium]MDH5250160.1 dienelactone hydrolase [Cyclobacteriaceae bacterium]